jgi:hypothetical protein
MARKHRYFRVNPATGQMEETRLRRSKARREGWFTDRTTARRRHEASRTPHLSRLDEELASLAAMGRDDLRALAVERDIPGRRNKGKVWLLAALTADARSRFASVAA